MLTWPGVVATQWGAAVTAVSTLRLGGVVLLSAPGDVPAAIARLDAANPRGVLVSVDEEGGSVQRLRSLGALPSAHAMAATHSTDEARALVAAHGRVIAAAGIDIVLGPVVDVAPTDGAGPLGDRTFFSDPLTVAAYGRAYVQGWRDAGLVPVLKHFPGHGSASADSHRGVARTPPLDVLEAIDLVPYRELAALAPAVMVGHLSVLGLTDDVPASLSRAAITGLLRSQLGYLDALVITDALEMGAVRAVATIPEAAVLALIAGADVALFSDPTLSGSVIDAIEAAVANGRIAERAITSSAERVMRARPIDIAPANRNVCRRFP